MKTRTSEKPLANMKGKFCPKVPRTRVLFCQEGECRGCQIFLDTIAKANEPKRSSKNARQDSADKG